MSDPFPHLALAQFWAKARPLPGALAPMHPHIAHSLDVAAVAMLLPGAARLGIDRRVLGFLVALHDIGKISRPFQAVVPALWPAAVLGGSPAQVPWAPHDALGLKLLDDALADALDVVLPLRDEAGRRLWTHGHRLILLRALAGHHGRPPLETDSVNRSALDGACVAAARQFVVLMTEIFRPPALPKPAQDRDRDVVRLGWSLAGLTTLADWVGSRQLWFPYAAPEAVADPADYFWNRALPQAAAAISAAGLEAAAASAFAGARGLFPGVTAPSPVQAWAETVPLPPGPVLAVIEDVTGSGKTEAALTLAHRLLSERRADGVFVALPTMATANAMFGRLASAYRALFAPAARPSLALAHRRAALHPDFVAVIAPDAGDRERRKDDPADEPAEAHCAAWLARGNRQALLAHVGVGTIDQALLSVLPVHHAPLRQQGLAGKVLIIDEAHAFDAYMTRELKALLSFHAAFGGSAILLSATLPGELRETLVNAFRGGLEAAEATPQRTDYPLATLASAASLDETPCAVREVLRRRVAVTRLPDADAAVERIVAASRAGAAVAWVRNTVDDAIAGAEALRAQDQDIKPLLFHARYAMADRLRIEDEVLRRFGRTSGGGVRNCVLVATQVIEQSLDLDFDLLCTDLAPVDLLIQRAGRLWRHPERPARPVPGPELLVVSPEPVDEPPADWLSAALPGTAQVYRDPALLWRGAKALFARGAIATPDDMRPLIEAAAGRLRDGAVPSALQKAAQGAEGKAISSSLIAGQNVLKFQDGYRRDTASWEPEELTPTRLEDRPQVTLRLAVVRDDVVLPYALIRRQGPAALPDEAEERRRLWALSEVVVARYHVAACPVRPGLEAAAKAARAGWTRWEREAEGEVLLAVMTEAEGGFIFSAQAESGAVRTVRYDSDRGVILPVRDAE